MFIFIHVCTESESFSTSSENGEGEFGTDRISGHLSPIHTDYCPQKQGGGGESQSSNKSIYHTLVLYPYSTKLWKEKIFGKLCLPIHYIVRTCICFFKDAGLWLNV